jgi:3-polyprenyl-4-hydroxybenzoate decarboxylase
MGVHEEKGDLKKVKDPVTPSLEVSSTKRDAVYLN